MLGYCAQGIIYGGTVLLGGGLRSPSAFLVNIIIIISAKEILFLPGFVCLSVCLWATLRKKL